ncbi:MAG: hypothetical protein HY667_02665 [Chloroflexi bacterium]|nr:hypothetical protein [Chloroflexota bacterium]
MLFIAQAGDTFNDAPVFDGGLIRASASALNLSVVYLIPKETSISLIAVCPAALAIVKFRSGTASSDIYG